MGEGRFPYRGLYGVEGKLLWRRARPSRRPLRRRAQQPRVIQRLQVVGRLRRLCGEIRAWVRVFEQPSEQRIHYAHNHARAVAELEGS